MLVSKTFALIGICASSAVALIHDTGITPAVKHFNYFEKRVVPYEWYVCGDNDRGPGTDPVVSYFRSDVERAVMEGYRRLQDGESATSSHGNSYPRTFHGSPRDNQYRNLNYRCGPSRPLVEYPLVQHGVFGDGNDAGLDRVIFDAWNGVFCGVLTHRGNWRGRTALFPCWGHNDPVFDPPIGPPRLDGPLPWLDGLGSGDLPMRVMQKEKVKPRIAMPQATTSVAATTAAATTTGDANTPVTSCSVVTTTETGTIIPTGAYTYCTCDNSIVAGINTEVVSNTVYSVCAASPFPTVGTATSLPSSGPAAQSVNDNPACEAIGECNAGGCEGLNAVYNETHGVCQSGDCTGYLCTNVCPSSPGPCEDTECNGQPDQVGAETGVCLQADLAGCTCSATSGCPSSPPTCDSCNGTSYANGTGICGPSDYDGCACTGTCPTDLPKCNDAECHGVNDPKGGDGICITGNLRGCSCASVCGPDGPCNLDGCAGWNAPSYENPGTCTGGDYIGCTCSSMCGQIQEQTCLSIANCSAILSSNPDIGAQCTDGDYKGCVCDPQCPIDPLIACGDDNCQGVDGQCEGGDYIGCDCDTSQE